MESRPGMWDSERVGAGAQVLKTRHGWLLIYHGVGMRRGGASLENQARLAADLSWSGDEKRPQNLYVGRSFTRLE